MHIVAARFKESIRWMTELPKDIPITIMDMAGFNGTIPERPMEFRTIPDAGRESYAYLCYILSDYDKLPDRVAFIQATPFDHCQNSDDPNQRNPVAVLGRLAQSDAQSALIGAVHACKSFEPLPPMCRRFKRFPGIKYTIHYGVGTLNETVENPMHPLIDVWSYLFQGAREIPAALTYSHGSLFMVHRDAIRQYHPEFYRRMLDLVSHAPLPMEAAALERLWPTILGIRA